MKKASRIIADIGKGIMTDRWVSGSCVYTWCMCELAAQQPQQQEYICDCVKYSIDSLQS